MGFEDRKIICAGCGVEFIFSAGEQEFYASKGFDKSPTRCQKCREEQKRQFRMKTRGLHEAICASCGIKTEVPFKPAQGRPVYCAECFRKNRKQ